MDDPAYAHEMSELDQICRDYLRAREVGNYGASLLLISQLIGQCATIWKLSPPAGMFDPRTLFDRDEGS